MSVAWLADVMPENYGLSRGPMIAKLARDDAGTMNARFAVIVVILPLAITRPRLDLSP